MSMPAKRKFRPSAVNVTRPAIGKARALRRSREKSRTWCPEKPSTSKNSLSPTPRWRTSRLIGRARQTESARRRLASRPPLPGILWRTMGLYQRLVPKLLSVLGQGMHDAAMAFDASLARLHGLGVHPGGHATLGLQVHGLKAMAAAAELRIVREQLLPDLLGHFPAMGFVLFPRADLACELTHQVARDQNLRVHQLKPVVVRQVAVRTSRAHADGILEVTGGFVLGTDELLMRVARETEFGAAGLVHNPVHRSQAHGADDQHQEAANGNTQEPAAFRPSPKSHPQTRAR